MVRYIECYNMVMIEKSGEYINKCCNSKAISLFFQSNINLSKLTCYKSQGMATVITVF